MKHRFDKLFLVGTFIFFILAVILFSYFEYQDNKDNLYRQIDEKLLATAKATALLLPSDFHDRIKNISSVTQSEDDRNIEHLSEFAENMDIAYIYTMISQNGQIYFTASSATDEERKSGKNLTRFFDPYDDASEELKKVFQTDRQTFAEYTDKWGTFRSVFIPLKTPQKTTYVVGADIRIDAIHKLLQEDALNLFLRLLGVIVFTLPFFTWRLRQINTALQEENKSLIEDLKNEQQHLLKLSQAVEQSPTSIIITDLEGNIEYANRNFFMISGYSHDEVIGKNPSLFKSDKTPRITYENLWEHLIRGENWHGEFINRSKDGTEYIQSVNISPIFQSDGTISHYMAIEEDITEKKRSEDRIYHLANFDSLTGLPNRAQLENHFIYILSLAKRSKTPFAVMFLDLDHFKEINDSLGHTVGDGMLIESANRFKSLMREADIVARLGGDEFVIVLSNTDIHGAEHIAQKILTAIAQPYHIEEYELNVSASIGIALYPLDGSDIDTLSKNADTAMYRAKQEGRNGYRFFTEEMQTKSLRNLQLSNALRNALKNDEFSLVYQPQISFRDGHVIGAEALLRWHHPQLGQISPAEFIPVAEENGLILPIGEWVLRTALLQVRTWMDNNQPPMVISVNLSAVQFRHHDLPNLVSRILHETNVPPEYLELELTESMAMHDPLIAINVINNLHARGIRMSIDDFGTGYSSLSYLKQFKIYKLKIDQSFVRDLSTDADDKAIVSAVINMAHSLGLQTIAEGVETLGQLEYLREQGCDEVQGYYYSRPVTADEFKLFMEKK